MPYCSKRVSRHFCTPSYVLLTVNGCTVGQSLVFVTRCKRHATWTGTPSRVYTSASYDHLALLTHIFSPLPQKLGVVRRPELLMASERCDEISCDDIGRCPVLKGRLFSSGRSRLSCFTVRRATPRLGVNSLMHWKRAGTNESLSDFSTVPKASLMSGVTRCTNSYSYWSDSCSKS